MAQTPPEPKYKIGDSVYHATTRTTESENPCPDCLGSGRWKVSSPAGYEGVVACPRCRGAKTIGEYCHAPYVQRLTIGQVRMEWPQDERRSGEVFEYMCRETGVGSGSIYKQSNLFATEKEANTVAYFKAFEANKALDKGNPERAKLRELHAYQLRDAAIREAERKESEARYKYHALIRHICELDEWPTAGGRFKELEEFCPLLVSLERKQIRAVQAAITWLDDDAAKAVLDSWEEETKT